MITNLAETKIALFEFDKPTRWGESVRNAVTTLGWKVVGANDCPELAVVYGPHHYRHDDFFKFLEEKVREFGNCSDVFFGVSTYPMGIKEKRESFLAFERNNHRGGILPSIYGQDESGWRGTLLEMQRDRTNWLEGESSYSKVARLKAFGIEP